MATSEGMQALEAVEERVVNVEKIVQKTNHDMIELTKLCRDVLQRIDAGAKNVVHPGGDDQSGRTFARGTRVPLPVGFDGPFASFSTDEDHPKGFKIVAPEEYLDEPLARLEGLDGLEWLAIPTRTAGGKIGMVAVLEERCSDGFESTLEDNLGEMMVYCDVWERVGIAQDGNSNVKVQGRKPKHKPEVQPRRRPKAEDYPPASEDPF